MKIWWVLIFLMFFQTTTPLLANQPSSLTFELSTYNWDEDMKRLKMTTPKNGLIFILEISNKHLKSAVTISNFRVDITSYHDGKYAGNQNLNINILTIPPKITIPFYIKVDLPRTNDAIGSWSIKAECEYKEVEWRDQQGFFESVPYAIPDKLEPYPFDFKIVSQEELEKQKQEQLKPILINIEKIDTDLIKSIAAVGILVVAIISLILAYRKKSRKRG